MIETGARDDLETIDQRLGIGPAMGFDHADDHVQPFGDMGAAGEQHLISLADAGGGAEENLQPAAHVAAGGLEQRLGQRPALLAASVVEHESALLSVRNAVPPKRDRY